MPESRFVDPALLVRLQEIVVRALQLADAHRLFDVSIGLDQAHQQLAATMRRRGLGDRVVEVPVTDEPVNDDDVS